MIESQQFHWFSARVVVAYLGMCGQRATHACRQVDLVNSRVSRLESAAGQLSGAV